MSYDNDVTETFRRARQSQINRICKSFSENPYDKEDRDYIEEAENVDLEKGVYKDNYENRKLGRVGQQFGGRKKEEPNKDFSYQKNIDSEANRVYKEVGDLIAEGDLTNDNGRKYSSVSSFLSKEKELPYYAKIDSFGKNPDKEKIYNDMMNKIKSIEKKDKEENKNITTTNLIKKVIKRELGKDDGTGDNVVVERRFPNDKKDHDYDIKYRGKTVFSMHNKDIDWENLKDNKIKIVDNENKSENNKKTSIYDDNGRMTKNFLDYLSNNKEKIWPKEDFSHYDTVTIHQGNNSSGYVYIEGKNKGGRTVVLDDARITDMNPRETKKNLAVKKLIENYKGEDSENKSKEGDSSYQKNIDVEANNLYTELSRDLKEGNLTNDNDKPYKSVSSYLKKETDWADDIDQDKFGEDVDWPTVYGDIVKKVKSLENKSNVKKAIDLDKEDGIEKDEKEDIEKSQLFDSISDYNNSIKFEKTGKEVKDQITNIVLPAKLADLKIAEANADTFLEDCGDKPARNVEPYWLEGLYVSVPYFIYDYDELRECPSDNESVSNSIKSSTINYASDSDEVTARRNYNDTVRQICSQIVDIVVCNTILKNLKDNAKLSLTPRQMVAFQFDK
jgi:hypothetical protein